MRTVAGRLGTATQHLTLNDVRALPRADRSSRCDIIMGDVISMTA
jgi:hypothetical protein